jgi:hypothetical protein
MSINGVAAYDFEKDDSDDFFNELDPMLMGQQDNSDRMRNSFENRQIENTAILPLINSGTRIAIERTHVGEPYGNEPVQQIPYTKHEDVNVGDLSTTPPTQMNHVQSTIYNTYEDRRRNDSMNNDTNAVYFPEYEYRTDQSFVNDYEKDFNYPIDPAFWWLEQSVPDNQDKYGLVHMNMTHVVLKTMTTMMLMGLVLFYFKKTTKEMLGPLLLAGVVGAGLALSPSCQYKNQ